MLKLLWWNPSILMEVLRHVGRTNTQSSCKALATPSGLCPDSVWAENALWRYSTSNSPAASHSKKNKTQIVFEERFSSFTNLLVKSYKESHCFGDNILTLKTMSLWHTFWWTTAVVFNLFCATTPINKQINKKYGDPPTDPAPQDLIHPMCFPHLLYLHNNPVRQQPEQGLP